VETVLDEAGVYAVAAKKDGSGCAVIANTTENDLPLMLDMNAAVGDCFLTANGENEKPTTLPAVLPRESIPVVHTER
jgi:hypothetical protein